MRRMAVLSGSLAVAVVALAAYRIHGARAASAELTARRGEHAASIARVAELEEKIRRAQKRAAEAEKDNGDLLEAAGRVRAARFSGAKITPLRVADALPLIAPVMPADLRLAPSALASARATAPGPAATSDEQMQLARARADAQALAKKRHGEAYAEAQMEDEIWKLEAQAKFERRMETVARYFAQAAFAEANRLLQRALAEKPGEVPVSASQAELAASVRAQATSVEVTLISDEATFVSVGGLVLPARFAQTVARIPPGDHEAIGRRTGFRDVKTMLRVRSGVPVPPVTIICTEALVR